VGQLGQHLHNPSRRHLETAYRLLHYIRGTLDYGIVFSKHNKGRGLVGFSDANFAGDQDRHSVGGYIFMLNGNPISWASRRQKTVSLSTEEAELNAASEATREAISLKSLCTELGVLSPKQNVMIKIDNRPALHVINNPGYYGRLKHVDICHKFVMEANQNKVVQVDWCSTDQMYADALTKPLGGPQLDLFRKNVMGNQFLAHLDR
jgi:hypothetical protein